MEIRIEEGKIKGSKDFEIIDETEFKEMVKYICKIDGTSIGTGFFCKIPLKDILIPVLMTNYHVINDDFFEQRNNLKVYINNEFKIINLNNKRKIYSSKKDEYDIMIIRIKENEDEINNFLEIDQNIFKYNSENLYKDDSIYILHYPNGDKASVSCGTGLEKINDFDIKHLCHTESGSSGGPILCRLTNKVIGIHKGFIKRINGNNFNIGTFLKFPLNELNNNQLTFENFLNFKYIDSQNNEIKCSNQNDNKKKINNNIIKAKKSLSNVDIEYFKDIKFELNILICGDYSELNIEKDLEITKIIKEKDSPFFQKGIHNIIPGWNYYFFAKDNKLGENLFKFIQDSLIRKKNKKNVILFYSGLKSFSYDNLIEFFEQVHNVFHPNIIIVTKKKKYLFYRN